MSKRKMAGKTPAGKRREGNRIRVEIRSESPISDMPARVCVYNGDDLISTVIAFVAHEQGADGGLYPVVSLRDAADLPAWKWAAHHDDSCNERIAKNGRCTGCGVHPDMQSKQLMAYCPRCDVMLRHGTCGMCKTTYRKPV